MSSFSENDFLLHKFDLQAELEASQKEIKQILLSVLFLKDTIDELTNISTVGEQVQPLNKHLEKFSIFQEQFEQCLEMLGIEPIPCVGLSPNPIIHHTVEIIKNPNVEGRRIIAEKKKGYYYKKQVLRKPEVIVEIPE